MFPPDLPPIKNKPLYVYRVFAKWLAFAVFGFNSLVLGLLVFPVMRLTLHPKTKFQKYGRLFVTYGLKYFVFVIRILKMAKLKTNDRSRFWNLKSKIVVANHPSLIDPVVLLSLMPNADTIVIPYSKNFVLAGIVRQLYILGSKDPDDVVAACSESLKLGNCLCVFPEGTRTPRSGIPILRKGAARIAIASGCSIVPVHIGGTDKFGLGKKDPWAGYNTQEQYLYDLTMGEEINPEKYSHLDAPAAAKLITDEIASFIFPGGNPRASKPLAG